MAGALLTVVFDLDPRRRPDPTRPLQAHIGAIAIEQQVSYEDY